MLGTPNCKDAHPCIRIFVYRLNTLGKCGARRNDIIHHQHMLAI